MLVRNLAQNLQSPHLLAKNLEIKIKGTVILLVWYGYGTLREEWRGGGGVMENATLGNQFGTKEGGSKKRLGKIRVMSFTACTYSKPYIMGDEVNEEYGMHETENEHI
jgi:hypothetical protein